MQFFATFCIQQFTHRFHTIYLQMLYTILQQVSCLDSSESFPSSKNAEIPSSVHPTVIKVNGNGGHHDTNNNPSLNEVSWVYVVMGVVILALAIALTVTGIMLRNRMQVPPPPVPKDISPTSKEEPPPDQSNTTLSCQASTNPPDQASTCPDMTKPEATEPEITTKPEATEPEITTKPEATEPERTETEKNKT
ncbi:uncharacterized protein LOC134176788 isoform X1 [Corticium candelabrum]|uniref:uncharacterized protein LOC134176788 isoform X1 n=2 Tax=Corticium candelabrum TaxID=121492 RepID=UPI002E261605|nr:uncharacterized protein LOC134176788 isoform X1 [Corticium candelabrum]